MLFDPAPPAKGAGDSDIKALQACGVQVSDVPVRKKDFLQLITVIWRIWLRVISPLLSRFVLRAGGQNCPEHQAG